MTATTAAKQKRLEEIIRKHAPLVVAYSGGVDSTYLLFAAHRLLGEKVLGIVADSPSLPRKALAQALALAEGRRVPVEIVQTEELDNPRYSANPLNRCYFCKAELFARLNAIARERGFRAVAYGENADDAATVRPGVVAAAEFFIIAPLREAALTKAEIRQLSRELDLPTADAPAQPCLSSRIPHGTPVTRGALAMIERAEENVRALGFVEFRVRHMAPTHALPGAKVQIAQAEMERATLLHAEIIQAAKRAGYFWVEIDPAGYRPPAKVGPAVVKSTLDKMSGRA